MARISSGLLGTVTGVFGNFKFRRNRDGIIVCYPRYPRDRRSPAQLEQRRRFSTHARIASVLYQAKLVNWWFVAGKLYNGIARYMELNQGRWGEWQGTVPFVLFPPFVKRYWWYEFSVFGADHQLRLSWPAWGYGDIFAGDIVWMVCERVSINAIVVDPGTLTGPSGTWEPPDVRLNPGDWWYVYGALLRPIYAGAYVLVAHNWMTFAGY